MYLAQPAFLGVLGFSCLVSFLDLVVGFSLLLVLVWPVPLAQSVTTVSTEFYSQNLVFWNLFEFSEAEIT